MKISTKGRYALRTMLELSLAEDGLTSVKAIALAQSISEKYLEQIMGKLSKAGLVSSVRGAQGGYRLSKSPEEYTVAEILGAIEGNLTPVSCMEDSPNKCPRSGFCVTLTVYQRLYEAEMKTLESITLEELRRQALSQREEKR
ncbi:MAG: Rrf2 family transcriptional regulator [Eubacteriales bacterium]|nr:Rrf2 family transcriptional regulator [Eubacteriales bacterium]MDD3883064.1 Rrf2 family transcriptional regulator [Eubacteriales bacterium]MDD4513615.1 Rrf2 family transcriptional regulator [Eubacteriales bacterium]